MGRMKEAFREISLAVELDPVSQGILKDKGIYYYYNRDYDKAIEMAKITKELDPGFSQAHRLLSMAYQGKGMYEEAIAENKIWSEKTGNKIKGEVALAQIYAAAGNKEAARNIIDKPEIEKILGGNDYRGIALVYAALGENDKAFEWLDKSFEHHEESLCSLKIDPKFDSIRSDPRFNKFLKKIKLID
jgi:tetratricopeptide (TPR) repeat protein